MGEYESIRVTGPVKDLLDEDKDDDETRDDQIRRLLGGEAPELVELLVEHRDELHHALALGEAADAQGLEADHVREIVREEVRRAFEEVAR